MTSPWRNAHATPTIDQSVPTEYERMLSAHHLARQSPAEIVRHPVMRDWIHRNYHRCYIPAAVLDATGIEGG